MRPEQTTHRPLFIFSSDEPGLIHLEFLTYNQQELPDCDPCLKSAEVFPEGEADEMPAERPSENENLREGSGRRVCRPETRDERLARIRSEIESGVYETDEKLELAIDRMLGVLLEE